MSFSNERPVLLNTVRKFIGQNWKRVLIWVLAALACVFCSVLTCRISAVECEDGASRVFPHYGRYNALLSVPGTVELQPGQSLEESFTAMGNIVGACSELYLKIEPTEGGGKFCLSVALWSEEKQAVLTETETEISEIPKDGLVSIPFPDTVLIRSAEDYRLTVTNTMASGSILLAVDHSVRSGSLTAAGESVEGALTYGFWRTPLYSPSTLTKCLILLTDATVLIGLALVLFADVKEHIMYLVLAIGFGVVMLFDLTPLYGFDMRFQFDSAYVLSNELLGLEGAVQMPSQSAPEELTTWYYRRACDDYSMFQFYDIESVSDNYVDMNAALRHLTVSPEKQEMVLVAANHGAVSRQMKLLYLPQAAGFAIARLLGLGFIPMVQLGRVAAYGTTVLLIFLAIRSAPFGKRLLLILALLPSVMTVAASISMDGMVIALSFFVIARVLQAAYGDRKPTIWELGIVMAFSALLAPSKSVYLPVSFFWLLIVYRQYLRDKSISRGKIALWTLGGIILVIAAFAVGAFASIGATISGAAANVKSAGAVGEIPEGFSVSFILTHVPYTCLVIANTLRTQLGYYLVNALQMFELGLGSDDTMTLLIAFLLLTECLFSGDGRRCLQWGERCFGALISLGVFLLVTFAAMQWTNLGNYAGVYSIAGIQGRYLIPVLPLMGISVMNNHLIQIRGDVKTLVKAGCCIFPAVYLMNMYLWTVAR